MTLGELLIKVGADTSGLNDLDKQIRGPIDKAGRNLQGTGRAMSTAISAPLGLIGGIAIKAAGDFEYAMNRVQALTSASGDQFAELKMQAKDLGATTAFSASQAADAMGFLAMAGFNTEQILASMPDTLNLAASAGMELGRAADIVSNIMTGFQLPVDESRRAVDVLVQSFTRANTDLEQLGQAFKYAGPIAKGLGLEFEETAALLSLFGNAGIQASSAGTGLRQGLAYLIRPSKDGAAALERLGVATTNAAGDLRNVPQILLELAEAGANTGDVLDIFGVRSAAAFQSVIAQIKENPATVSNFLDTLGEASDGAGRAAEVAAVQMRGFNGALIALKSAAEAVAIAVGESGVLDGLTKLINKATEVVRAITQTNPALLRFVAAMTGVLIAAGPVVLLIGKMTTLFAPLASAFAAATATGAGFTGALGAALAAINPVVAVVAGLAVAVGVLYSQWDKISAFMNGPGSSAVESFKQVYASLQGTVAAVMEAVRSVVGAALQFISDLWDRYGEAIMIIASTWFNATASAISGVLDILTGLLQTFSAAFRGDWRGMWEGIKNIGYAAARAVIGIVTGLFDGMFGLLQAALGRTRTMLTQFAVQARSSSIPGSDVVADMAGGLVSALDAVNGKLYEGRGAIRAFGDASRYLGRSMQDIEDAANSASTSLGTVSGGGVATPDPDLPTDPGGGGGSGSGTGDGDKALTDAERRAQRIAELFGEVNTRIAQAVAKASAFGTPLQAAEARAQEIRRTFESLIDEGIEPTDSRMQALLSQFGAASAEVERLQRAFDIREALDDMDAGLAVTLLKAQALPGAFNSAEEQISVLTEGLQRAVEAGMNPLGLQAEMIRQQIALLRVEAEAVEQALTLTEARNAFAATNEVIEQYLNLTGDYGAYLADQIRNAQVQLEELLPILGANSAEVQVLYEKLMQLQQLEQVTKLVEGALQSIGNAFLDFAVDATTGLFQMIAGAESSVGSIGDLAKGLLSSVLDTLGNLLIQVGVTALGVGTGLQAIVTALSSLNPYVAIAAGVALVALGAAVKASLGNVAKGGGGASGGYQVLGTYGGSGQTQAPQQAAEDDRLIEEVQGMRRDLRALANRPLNFTGDPREFERAQSVADERAARVTVSS